MIGAIEIVAKAMLDEPKCPNPFLDIKYSDPEQANEGNDLEFDMPIENYSCNRVHLCFSSLHCRFFLHIIHHCHSCNSM